MNQPTPEDRSDPTDPTDPSKSIPRKLRPVGGYRHLRSFQVATIIYDATVAFCDRFISGRSRTHDQMVQAARSGRQNIAEGNRAGGTSSKSELHLTNVARASLEELLLDFEDYLRQRRLPQWAKDSPEAKCIRAVGWRRKDPPDPSDPTDLAFPKCPLCAKPMSLRIARQGKNSGKQFWGCTGYPDCKGAAPLDP